MSHYYELYIAADEEVTTIISRMHAAPARLIALVIPQRALVLQSIINLRLLVREAQKQQKEIIVVTQDEQGAVLAERVGIDVQPLSAWHREHAGDMAPQQNNAHTGQARTPRNDQMGSQHFGRGVVGQIQQQPKEHRAPMEEDVTPMPAHPTYDAPPVPEEEPVTAVHHEEQDLSAEEASYTDQEHDNAAASTATQAGAWEEGGVHTEQPEPQSQQDVSTPEHTSTNRRSGMDIAAPRKAAGSPQPQMPQRQSAPQGEMPFLTEETLLQRQLAREREAFSHAMAQERGGGGHYETENTDAVDAPVDNSATYGIAPQSATEEEKRSGRREHEVSYKKRNVEGRSSLGERVRALFARKAKHAQLQPQDRDRGTHTYDAQPQDTEHASHKKFFFGGAALIVLIIAIATLPYARITLHLQNTSVSDDVRITAGTEYSAVDVERRTMPLRVIERDITRTITVPTTGASQSDAQKARGTITIYNAYSKQPQPLVATTRFLTEDGTLFRLAQATTVPGMSEKDGTLVPGSVEALVIADQSGPDGNIDPARFSIPGFKGSAKYDKFYGQTTVAMTGGSDGSDAVPTVSEDDLTKAKTTAEEDIDQYVHDALTELLRPNEEMLLGDAWTYEITRSEGDAPVSAATKEIAYTVDTHVRALVFVTADVEKIARAALLQRDETLDKGSVQYDIAYKKSEASFDDEKLTINVAATAQREAAIDEDAFRNAVVGKSKDALGTLVRDEYPMVESMSLAVFPPFPGFIANHISTRPWMTRVIVE